MGPLIPLAIVATGLGLGTYYLYDTRKAPPSPTAPVLPPSGSRKMVVATQAATVAAKTGAQNMAQRSGVSGTPADVAQAAAVETAEDTRAEEGARPINHAIGPWVGSWWVTPRGDMDGDYRYLNEDATTAKQIAKKRGAEVALVVHEHGLVFVFSAHPLPQGEQSPDGGNIAWVFPINQPYKASNWFQDQSRRSVQPTSGRIYL